MSRTYTPRRCSKRWLDGDCPEGVLAIIDTGPNGTTDRYTIIYRETYEADGRTWLTYYATSADLGFSGLGELQAHEVADYRYRSKHYYATWTSLPKAVQDRVREHLKTFEEASR